VYDTGVEWIAPEAAFVDRTIAARVPVLGICFGAQLLAHVLGGSVAPTGHPEQGFTSIDSDDPLLVPTGPWMQMHNDCFTVPPQGRELARNRSGSQAFTAGPNLGVQFHPEITADCFDSWIERWDIATERPSAFTDSRALETLRREVAAREKSNIELCHQLIHTFVTRCSSFR
jgi:GMP synthase (glutamine-hydrolysing)